MMCVVAVRVFLRDLRCLAGADICANIPSVLVVPLSAPAQATQCSTASGASSQPATMNRVLRSAAVFSNSALYYVQNEKQCCLLDGLFTKQKHMFCLPNLRWEKRFLDGPKHFYMKSALP